MPVSSYKVIADELEEFIKKGFISTIPSQRTLCFTYGSSNRTVQKAMNALVAKGLIYSKPGKGYYLKKDGS